ncbi:CLUMA_CG016980, isoform A [Clunio marinus]|uniref:CLUMA_CG016980, isoform A n=1 Tax=Clunio marinus TaxID=568069 RepID=A0A1J1IVW6_9DIPT|nr:CLUMA_CG016980, isoform A [Clunio marinus]
MRSESFESFKRGLKSGMCTYSSEKDLLQNHFRECSTSTALCIVSFYSRKFKSFLSELAFFQLF